jgi:hypothetical protein
LAPLVGISKHTRYAWNHKVEAQGPAGLLDHPRGAPTGSRLPEVTRRAIRMLKEAKFAAGASGEHGQHDWHRDLTRPLRGGA